VERHARLLLLIKVLSRNMAEVVGAFSKHVRKLPANLRSSLTWDRRLEMAKHKDVTPSMRVKTVLAFLSVDPTLFTERPLSPSFHPQSLLSDDRSLPVGRPRYSRRSDLIIDLGSCLSTEVGQELGAVT
jgi:hypothetical protein